MNDTPVETNGNGDRDESIKGAPPLMSEKQPVLTWKKNPKKRPRIDLNSGFLESATAAEFASSDTKNEDRRSAADEGPLIIPVPQNVPKWQKPPQRPSETDDVATKAAIQALQDEVHAEDPTVTTGTDAVKIEGRDNTFAANHDLQQYQRDLESLPAALEESAEAYQRVPIEQFGAALLRGMGWKEEEEGQGSSSKHGQSRDVVPRPHRLGLGAMPILPEAPSDEPSGERQRPKSVHQYQRDQRLKEQQASYRVEREQLRAADRQRTLQDGSIVRLVQDGTRARIRKLVGVPGLNMVQIQREGDTEPSVIKRNEMDGLVSREELEQSPFLDVPQNDASQSRTESASRKSKNSKDDRTSRREDDRKRERTPKSDRSRDERRSTPEKRRDRTKAESFAWVIPNIRVRIITEKLGRRYYKEKGIVMDVTRASGITVQLTNGEVVQEIPERYLETALPKPGGNVIVLSDDHGAHRHARGRLLERDSRTGLVQLYEDMNCISVSLDDIAEWCGPLDDDEME